MVGVIAIVAIDILRAAVGDIGRAKPTTVAEGVTITSQDSLAAVIYLLTLAILYKVAHKYTVIGLVLCGAVAGQFLFV